MKYEICGLHGYHHIPCTCTTQGQRYDNMVFTKDDIRVYLEQHGDQRFYMSLLNRMERAEVCIDAVIQHTCVPQNNCWKCKAIKEWKESAGLIKHKDECQIPGCEL